MITWACQNSKKGKANYTAMKKLYIIKSTKHVHPDNL